MYLITEILKMFNKNTKKENIDKPLIPVKGPTTAEVKAKKRKEVLVDATPWYHKTIKATINTEPLRTRGSRGYSSPIIDFNHLPNYMQMSVSGSREFDRAVSAQMANIYRDVPPKAKKPEVKKTVTSRESKTGSLVINFRQNDNYSTYIEKVYSTTANCQTSSLRHAKHLIYILEEDEVEVFNILSSGRKQLLIDINADNVDILEPMFLKYADIVIKQPYTNSNTSPMVLYLWKWKITESKEEVEIEEINRINDDLSF